MTSWETSGANDDWGMASAGLCAGQWPGQMDIESLQQHIQELEQWKYHAEASMRMLQKSVEWQAAIAAASTASGSSGFDPALYGTSPAAMAAAAAASSLGTWPAGPLSPMDDAFVPLDRATFAASSTTAASSPRSSSPAATSLSQLPPPMRLHLGPEPGSKKSHPSSPQGRSGEASMPGLLPPGLTLAMAASLTRSSCAGEGCATPKDPEVSPKASQKGGRLPAPPGLAPGADRPATKKHASPRQFLESCPKVDLFPAVPLTEVSPGIFLGSVDVLGHKCTRAEWRIDSVRAKLQASMGRPLVSPSFAARGLPNLRLMVLPDPREAVKNARNRERKSMYTAMVKKGPLQGSLKLKADCLEHDTVLSFFLTVGTVRCGPFTYDFSECAIRGCDDFNADWLKQVDDVTGDLCVGVEILDGRVVAGCGSGAGSSAGTCNSAGSWPLGAALADPAEMYRSALGEHSRAAQASTDGEVRMRGQRGPQQRMRGC